MAGRRGERVEDRERVFGLEDLVARDVSLDDLRKYVLIVIGPRLVLPSHILLVDAGNAEPVHEDGPYVFRPDTFLGPKH